MKSLLKLMSVAIMATCVFSLVSCGGDNDEEIINGGGSPTEVTEGMGVHKVVFTVSGAYDKFNWIATANGMTMVNDMPKIATIYDENGVECKQIDNVTSKTFMTNKYGTKLVVAFVVTALKDNQGVVDKLTISLEGFIDDKKVDSKTYEFDNSKDFSETYSLSI